MRALSEDERGELDNALSRFWSGDADEDSVAGVVEQLILAPRMAAWLEVVREHQYLSDEEKSGYGWCSCGIETTQAEHFAHVVGVLS